MSGCSFVLVAIGFIIVAFGLGIFTTYRQYKADPQGFERDLKEEYRIMEEKAEQKAQEKAAAEKSQQN